MGKTTFENIKESETFVVITPYSLKGKKYIKISDTLATPIPSRKRADEFSLTDKVWIPDVNVKL